MIYTCNRCQQYKTQYKSNYNRHLKRKKPCVKTTKKKTKTTKKKTKSNDLVKGENQRRRKPGEKRNLNMLVLCASTKSIVIEKSLNIISDDISSKVLNITYVGDNINLKKFNKDIINPKSFTDNIKRDYINLDLYLFAKNNNEKFDIIVNELCPFFSKTIKPISDILVNNLKIGGLFYSKILIHMNLDIGQKINLQLVRTVISKPVKITPFKEYKKISNK